MKVLPPVAVLAFVLLTCAPGLGRFASPEDDAVLALARAGDAEAQAALGAMFEDGRGGAPDYDAAALWYRRSAWQGNAYAAYRLGELHERGRGVARDLDQAMAWYRRAAEAGNESAAFRLGQLYEQGANGHRDVREALRWYRAAAAGWRARARYPLAPDFALAGVAPDDATTQPGSARLHLASLPSAAEAATAWTALQNAYPDVLGGLSLEVVPLDLGTGVFHQVRAGPLSLDAATAACAALHARGRFCQPVP